MNPKMSIVLCTYNGKGLVEKCLESILAQKYRNFEILCVDGMSSDDTREIISYFSKKDKRVKLIINKKRLPEGKGNGKWLGHRKSRGEIIAFIDQDNILQNDLLFESVIKTFEKKKGIIGILGGLKHDKKDKAVVRFVSLFGTDAFFAYRSLDFIRNIKKLKTEKINFLNLESCPMETDNMLLTGGNCFFYKKTDIERAGGFDQDVLLIRRLITLGRKEVLVLANSTKHYAERNLYGLIRKKFFWGRKFRDVGKKFDYLPGTPMERRAFSKNMIFNLLIFPNFYYSLKIFKSSGDYVSFLFPVMAFLNTLAYGYNFLISKIKA